MARLDPTSKVERGREAELWLDATKVKLFDPGDGRPLTASGGDAAPDASDGQSPEGRDPEAA